MPYRLPHPEAAPPKLNPENVPKSLHHLIPLAEKYGISDDCYRIDVLDLLDESERAEILSALEGMDLEFENWLAGPESFSRTPTNEYVAFAALCMAGDALR